MHYKYQILQNQIQPTNNIKSYTGSEEDRAGLGTKFGPGNVLLDCPTTGPTTDGGCARDRNTPRTYDRRIMTVLDRPNDSPGPAVAAAELCGSVHVSLPGLQQERKKKKKKAATAGPLLTGPPGKLPVLPMANPGLEEDAHSTRQRLGANFKWLTGNEQANNKKASRQVKCGSNPIGRSTLDSHFTFQSIHGWNPTMQLHYDH